MQAGVTFANGGSGVPTGQSKLVAGLFTHRPLTSSFLGLPYRILNIDHKKELLGGLWVARREARTGRKRRLPTLESRLGEDFNRLRLGSIRFFLFLMGPFPTALGFRGIRFHNDWRHDFSFWARPLSLASLQSAPSPRTPDKEAWKKPLF